MLIKHSIRRFCCVHALKLSYKVCYVHVRIDLQIKMRMHVHIYIHALCIFVHGDGSSIYRYMRMRSTFFLFANALHFFELCECGCMYIYMYVCLILCVYTLFIPLECVRLMYMKVHMYVIHPNVCCTSDVYEDICVYYTSQCMEGRGTSHTSR